jgi:hypothetical protein
VALVEAASRARLPQPGEHQVCRGPEATNQRPQPGAAQRRSRSRPGPPISEMAAAAAAWLTARTAAGGNGCPPDAR